MEKKKKTYRSREVSRRRLLSQRSKKYTFSRGKGAEGNDFCPLNYV